MRYINVDVKHDESHCGVTEVIVVARLAACAVLSCWCPNSNKKFIFILLLLFFQNNIKFKVALRQCRAQAMVISVSNHGAES